MGWLGFGEANVYTYPNPPPIDPASRDGENPGELVALPDP